MANTPLVFHDEVLDNSFATASPASFGSAVRTRSLSDESLPSPPSAKRRRADVPSISSSSCLSLTAKALALKAKGIAAPRAQPDYATCLATPQISETESPEVNKKDRFVAGLVGASVIAIESIWGCQSPVLDLDASPVEASVLPLHFFVREVLRRSRTSCSTLQVALYYLHKSRREIRDTVARAELAAFNIRTRESSMTKATLHEQMSAYPSPPLSPVDQFDLNERFAELEAASTKANPILCGRRMFLASLIAASKFLQDRNYSNRAWAKISGLDVAEINQNERAFLGLLKFELHLGADDFQKWTERLASLSSQGAALETAASSPSMNAASARMGLARHATEYAPAAALHDLRPLAGPRVASHGPLGRNYSVPEVGAGNAQPSLRARPHLQVMPCSRTSPLRQTATPLATPNGSPVGSSMGLNDSPTSEASPPLEMLARSNRRVLPVPAPQISRRNGEVPIDFRRVLEACGAVSSESPVSWLRNSVPAH